MLIRKQFGQLIIHMLGSVEQRATTYHLPKVIVLSAELLTFNGWSKSTPLLPVSLWYFKYDAATLQYVYSDLLMY